MYCCFILPLIEYSDEGVLWRELYEIPNDGLEAMVDKLYEEVKPMYKLLHAFIRRRLSEEYPGRVQRTGPIPAHVFGKTNFSETSNNNNNLIDHFFNVYVHARVVFNDVLYSQYVSNY